MSPTTLAELRWESASGQLQPDLVILCLDNWAALQADRSDWPLLRASRIEGADLVRVAKKWLPCGDKPHRLDILVVILRDVRGRSRSTWLPPVSLEFQALCGAGRFSEAERILDDYPEISIKGRSARSYLESARTHIAEREGSCTPELDRLWELVNHGV